MGRPKGSKNKVHKKKLGRPRKCRRGRPKGTTKKVVCTESYDMSKVKKFKFLGYCKKCEALISSKELVKKTIYECPCCHKRDRVTRLLNELEREKPKSKKEYLDSTIHASHIETLPLNDVSIDPSDLKIQE